jgi:excinuclease ABC subunit B
MAKNPKNPKKPVKTPKSKAHRPDVQPIGPALAELLNPAINRGDAGVGSTTGTRSVKESTPLPNPPPQGGREKNSGLRPPPDNSKDRRSGGEAAVHRARASTRGTSDDVAKRDAGAKRDVVTKRDDASSSPPPAREARGGEGSGVGGGAAFTEAAVPADRPPTPDLESELRSPRTPPLRGGRGEAAAARMKGKCPGNENP